MKNRRSHRLFGRKRQKQVVAPLGSPPGTLVSQPGATPPALHVLGYGPDVCEELTPKNAEELRSLLGRWPILWLNVEGVDHAESLEAIGNIFGLHRLALEDIANTHQRAKFEEYPDFDFIVARMCGECDTAGLHTEQAAICLGKNFVITFQEGIPRDCLNSVRERLRKPQGRMRGLGADYLAYAILDAIVDSYFPVLENLGDQLETLEDGLIDAPTRETAMRIHDLKRQLLTLRRATWPLRDVFNVLVRDESPRVCAETRVYFRDCYDHVVRQIDLVETYREMCSDMMDLYLSSVSQRMNEIMKVLTLMSTVFLPLTFIAGIYGMNFDPDRSPWNMPELRWYFGYPFSLGLMIATVIGMVIYFRRKGWIGMTPPKSPAERDPSAPTDEQPQK